MEGNCLNITLRSDFLIASCSLIIGTFYDVSLAVC